MSHSSHHSNADSNMDDATPGEDGFPVSSFNQSQQNSSAALEQLLQFLEQSNAQIESLLEKLLALMETQQQNLDALDRRADQLAGQINSLKNS